MLRAARLVPFVVLASLVGCGGPPPSPESPVAPAPPPPPPPCASYDACASGCDTGDGAACDRFVGLARDTEASIADSPRALRVFEAACANGNPTACAFAGDAYRTGRGTDPDPAKAKALLGKACDGGEGVGCNVLAPMEIDEAGSPESLTRAADLLAKGCDAGDFPSCVDLARFVEHGVKPTVPATPAELRTKSAALEKLCAEGRAGACHRLGIGLQSVDPKHAAEVTTRACDLGHTVACIDVGNGAALGLSRFGNAIQQDPPRALELLRRACAMGNMRGCSGVVTLRDGVRAPANELAETEAKILAFDEEACRHDDASGCEDAARRASSEPAVATPHLERARSLWHAACGRGRASACTSLAETYEHPPVGDREPTKAESAYERGCALSPSGGACFRAGRILATGDGVAKDGAKAAALFGRTCDARKEGLECDALARMLEDGAGVPRDPSKAAAIRKNACRAGDRHACLAWGDAIVRGDAEAPLDDAVAAWGSACDKGVLAACDRLGAASEHGIGAPKDDKKAANLYAKACAEEPAGCYHLALLRDRVNGKKDADGVAKLFETACSRGHAQSCARFGVLAAKGAGVAKDPKVAEGAQARACFLGDPASCVGPAAKHTTGAIAPDWDKLEPECRTPRAFGVSSQIDGPVCMQAGYFAEHGITFKDGKPSKGKADVARASELYDIGCRSRSFAPACAPLAALAKDRARAAGLARLACLDGDAGSCAIAARAAHPSSK